jgi:glycosyltransferase involved in cell wall biosynthesis
MLFEDTYKLPKKFEGLECRKALETAFVTDLILKQCRHSPNNEIYLQSKKLEIFAGLAKLESLAGIPLFKREWDAIEDVEIEQSFVLARKSLGRICPLSKREWVNFFKPINNINFNFLNNEYSVSLVVPVFKPKNFLDGFLSQLEMLSQYFSQIIIVDDESPIEDYTLLNDQIKKYKKVEIYRLEKNSGPGAARNLGISKVRSDWVTFMDFDDQLDVDLIPYVLLSITNSKNTNAFTTHLLKKPKNRYFLSQILSFPDLAFQNQVAVNLFLKMDLLKKIENKIYNEKLKGHFEDWEANLALRLLGVKPSVLPLTAYIYNIHYEGRQLSDVNSQWESRLRLLDVFNRNSFSMSSNKRVKIIKLLALELQKISHDRNKKLRSSFLQRLSSMVGF